jgi:transposase
MRDDAIHFFVTVAPNPTDLPSAIAVINQLTIKNEELQQQLDWFRRQLFGKKSEKQIKELSPTGELNSGQLWLGGAEPERTGDGHTPITVKGHVRERRGKQSLEDDCGESGLRFDSTVPVEETTELPPEVQNLPASAYEIIDTKVTERLCQRSGSYFIKRSVRPVVKLKESGTITSQPAPPAVLERSYADVSLLSGILVDKIQFYLPLYRQHQRMLQFGVMIARANLTHWFHRAAALLEPIYMAVLYSVLESQVLAMDETPLKAGYKEKGKLHQGYVWALYGDKDEAAFLYSPTRALDAIEPLLKKYCGTLITDGYTVYDKLCARYTAIVHALCWAHTRREFFEAQEYEPERCGKALEFIGKLYEHEAAMREQQRSGEKKLLYRVEYERPIVDRFFEWLHKEVEAQALLPSNRFLKAAAYALEREQGLRVFLSDPQVPIDTNHLERQIRPLPMGRKNWMFCWTEVGAEAVAIVQTLVSCCKLAGVNPFDYFVDVLQKIDSHPQARVHELTPRLWALSHNSALTLNAPV